MNFLVIFIILSTVNVIFSTVKSICTIKSNKVIASLVNGLYYGYYNIVLIYTVQDFPLLEKCIITCVCNLIGVFIVKWIEEKTRKDKLWKIEMTIPKENTTVMAQQLEQFGISHNFIENVGNYSLFNCYCENQKESTLVKEIGEKNKAKFFASETKIL